MNRTNKSLRSGRRGLVSLKSAVEPTSAVRCVRGGKVLRTQEEWRVALISEAKRQVSHGRLKQMKQAHEKLVAEILASRELEEA